MDIEQFKNVISKLNKKFNSHEFIELYIYFYENEYINMLNEHKGNDAFKKVNSFIGNFLAKNVEKLGIENLGKVESRNVHGNITKVEEWKNLDKK